MIAVFKKFFDFSGEENKKLFIRSIWLGVISALCSAIRIPAVYIVLKALLLKQVTNKTLYASLGVLVVSVVVTILINMKTTMMQTKAGYRTCANKRMEIAEHLRYLPMGWFNANSLGEIASVTTNTMDSMANIATRVVMVSTKGILISGIIVIMMLAFDVRIGLIALTGLVIFMLVNGAMQKVEVNVSERKIKADENLVAKVLEYIQGIAEVKNYNLTKNTSTEVRGAIEESRKANFAMEIPSVVFVFLQSVTNKLTGVVICMASLWFYFDGSMSLPDCFMMLICSYVLFEQLDSTGIYSTLIRSINIGVDKVNKILETETMDIDGMDIEPSDYSLRLEHVNFYYDKRKIIDDVSLTIPEKNTVAIVGPSGSGKTTLCNLMARFWDVQKGNVLLGNKNVKEYSYDSLMKNFSFVFQRTYLFSDTIANNIRFGNPDATMDEVIAASKKARCHDFIMALPDGYDTVIGEGGASISGGERQRITIARAIMKDAPIIILDEATANVDPENEVLLTRAIEELTKNKTIIMIAHRLKTVQHADKILVLDGGKIVQQGKHEELMRQEGIYRNFVLEREKAISWKVG